MLYFCHVKLFKRIVSIIIWGIIALNLLSAGVLSMPGVQQFVGRKAATLLEDKLGTKVSVGSVSFGLFNRLILDDVHLFDQQKKEMLRVGRLSAKIDVLPLAEGRISISSAQLFGAHARLYRKDANSAPNFQFVLDSLASRDTTNHTPLDLRINTLIIRHSSVTFDQNDIPQTEQFSPAHLHVSDITAHINLRALTDDSLNVNVRRLGFHEGSGLDVSRLAFQLKAGRQNALLSNFLLQMPSSQLCIDTLTANYKLQDTRLVPGSLTFSGSIRNTEITPSDLRCFVPSLKNFQRALSLTTDINGTDQIVNIPQLLIATAEKDIDVNVNGWVSDWNTSPAWHLQVNQFTIAEARLEFLSKLLQLPPELTRVGNLQLAGSFDRNRQGETALNSLVRSGAGDVDLQLSMDAAKKFVGSVKTEGINLRQILAEDKLGKIAANLSFEGLWKQPAPDVKVSGQVPHFDYNDYTFSNISLSGSYLNKALTGNLLIDDPHLKAQLEGEVTDDLFDNTSTRAKHIKLKGDVSHFSPAATHLSTQFGEAVVTGVIDADFTANNLNDAQGSLSVSNFAITATEQQPAYQLDNLYVSSGYQDGVHFVSLKSDFADVELKGQFDYATLPQTFINLVGSKLPTLPGLPAVSKTSGNNFSVRLFMSKADWLRRFLGVDLVLRQPIALNAVVNDNTRLINLEGDLPSFAYNGSWYANGDLHISSPADTLKCDLSLQKIMDDGNRMGVNLLARAANNSIDTSLHWDNNSTEKHMSGQLNAIVRLYRNLLDKPEAHVRVLPSHIILNNATWNLEPSDVIYAENHLLVDHFSVNRGQQHIIIDGIASRNETDTLSVDLNEVEVDYILDLVNFHSVEFSGKATGRAVATSLFSKFAAAADLEVSDFKFEKGRMGVLDAHARWNTELEQIDIHAIADDGPEAKTFIDGYVSPVHNTIDLGIRAEGTYIDFMHNFTKSFLSHVTGNTNGGVRLYGTLDNINLTGSLLVDGEATVTALNTTYKLERDTVVLIPDDILINRLPVHDRDDNIGYLSGGIHHQHLTNLSFDLALETDNLLAYDFHDFGDNLFYGTVYAGGDVKISGRGNEVTIDCNVTPQKNSVFVYNASSPDAIASQEFINWTDDDNPNSQGITLSRPSRATDTDIYLNFLINATPDATLRLLMDARTGDYITLFGDGAIRATYHNKGAFNMFGTYTVDHGTYGITIQNIIKKLFTFNRGGTIVFGGDPYQAALNLQAVYTVNAVSLSDLNIGNSFASNTIRVNCLMNIGGQPATPTVDFDLEMPTVSADEQQMIRSVINGQQEMNQQVVYLLAIGRFYNQGVNNSNENQQTGATTLAMQSLLSGTLSTQINTLLGALVKNENWNFGANISTGNEGWHNAEYEGIINGRMLNNRLLFNGQFGYRDNATKATPSFIGDFDVQYLLYPNGNLALKVYNQTNDRYFTKSSMNTQGIGLIMKKDFNGIRDLFTSSRRKGRASRAGREPDPKP